jgi:3-hydroxybutyryl-CoA dehydrogenase
MQVDKIGVIGAGNMGSGLALLFSMHGFNVSLFMRNISKAQSVRDRISSNIDVLIQHDVLEEGSGKDIQSRIEVTNQLDVVAKDAKIIIENIVEDLAVKKEYFAKLDALTPPDVILASNTSVISITEIGENCKYKERVIGTHFWNPPYLIPLVEVIKTVDSSDEVVERVYAIMERANKQPVIAQKDAPGFIANRMQHALFREALNIVERGIATPEDVDKSIKYGFGMRLGICAPIEVMDMGGMDLTSSIHDYLFPDLADAKESQQILKDKIAAGELGFKTQKGIEDWPDERIAASRENLNAGLIKILKALDRI